MFRPCNYWSFEKWRVMVCIKTHRQNVHIKNPTVYGDNRKLHFMCKLLVKFNFDFRIQIISWYSCNFSVRNLQLRRVPWFVILLRFTIITNGRLWIITSYFTMSATECFPTRPCTSTTITVSVIEVQFMLLC